MYTTNDELSTIHFLNDQNIVQELSVAEEGKLNPIPSLSLLNKVNDDLGKRIDDGNDTVESISGTIALSVENLSGLLNKTIDEHSLSIGNLSGLLDATITSCDGISKRIDGLDADVSADNGEVVTSVKQEAGKIVSVGSAKITDDYVDKISEGKITGLSDDLKNLSAHYDNYVKKTGDSITNLTVDNDLSVGKNVSFGTNFKVSEDGFIETEFIKTSDHNGLSVIGQGTEKNGVLYVDLQNAKMNLKGSTEGFEINGTSLSGHIKNAIDALDVSATSLTSMQMIGSIKQEDGKISVSPRTITSADIPTLPQEKIANLTKEYLKTDDFNKTLSTNDEYLLKDGNISLKVVKDELSVSTFLELMNTDSGKFVRVNVDGFIAGQIAESIDVVSEDPSKPGVVGPFLKVTWKYDKGTKTTYTPIKDLIEVYTEGDGISIKDRAIGVDYTKVTSKKSFDPIEGYVHLLSDEYGEKGTLKKPGVISQLSGDVQEAFLQNVRNVKLDGCIKHYEKGKGIGEILAFNSEVGSEYSVRNNALYKVCVTEPKSTLSTIFTSFEGLTFTNSDYILVHKDDASIKRIPPESVQLSDVTVIKAGVSKIDLDTEAFLRLSADNNLSVCIWNLDNSITLSGGLSGELSNTVAPEALSVLTKVTQEDGKVTFEAKPLLSSDVAGLSGWVKAKIGELAYDSHDLCSDAFAIISVITELKQVNGEISYKTKPLDYTNVSGLTGYVNEKIGDLDVSADISAVSADHKLVYCVTEEDGKISTYSRCLTSADFYDDDLSVWNKLCVDLVDGLPEICSVISTEVHEKIWIKNPTGDATLSAGAYSDLSVIKLPKEEYEQKVIDGTLNESCLYVVSSDYIDAYGEPLCNLTMPEGYEGVAVTKPYVDEKLGNVQTGVDTLLASMWAELSVCYKEHNYQLSNYTCGDAISAVYNLTKIIGGYFKFVPPTVE